MADTLTTTNATGAQTATQNPQTAAPPSSSANQTSDIQPGTSASTLNNSSGISLQTSQLNGIPLTGTATNPAKPVATPHHASSFITVAALSLFILAIALFALIMRADKNTTN